MLKDSHHLKMKATVVHHKPSLEKAQEDMQEKGIDTGFLAQRAQRDKLKEQKQRSRREQSLKRGDEDDMDVEDEDRDLGREVGR